jgi:hypothetical protein
MDVPLCADRSHSDLRGRGKTYRIKGFRFLTSREVRRKRCRVKAALYCRLNCNAWVAAYQSVGRNVYASNNEHDVSVREKTLCAKKRRSPRTTSVSFCAAFWLSPLVRPDPRGFHDCGVHLDLFLDVLIEFPRSHGHGIGTHGLELLTHVWQFEG